MHSAADPVFGRRGAPLSGHPTQRIAVEPGSNGGGVESSPIRPSAGTEKHGPGGLGLGPKGTSGRLSYAAAVSGLVEHHVSDEISQSELSDCDRPGLDELRRQEFDEFRRPELDEFLQPDSGEDADRIRKNLVYRARTKIADRTRAKFADLTLPTIIMLLWSMLPARSPPMVLRGPMLLRITGRSCSARPPGHGSRRRMMIYVQ